MIFQFQMNYFRRRDCRRMQFAPNFVGQALWESFNQISLMPAPAESLFAAHPVGRPSKLDRQESAASDQLATGENAVRLLCVLPDHHSNPGQ
jgi:hypothetical protein